MNKVIILAAGLAVAGPVAMAEEAGDLIPGDFTANVGLASDYAFRGISQTNENPALQGGIDYTSPTLGPTNLYLGLWGSNVDFDVANDDASLELDLYGGIKGSYDTLGLGWDLGVIGYTYPGANGDFDYDYVEAKFGLTKSYADMLTLAVAYFWSPDGFGVAVDDTHYLNGSVTVAPPQWPLGLSLTGSLGHMWMERTAAGRAAGIISQSTDWSVGVGATIEGFAVSLAYVDTDISDSECARFAGNAGWCDARAILKVARSF